MPIQQFDPVTGAPRPPNYQCGGDLPNPGQFPRAGGVPLLSPQPVAFDFVPAPVPPAPPTMTAESIRAARVQEPVSNRPEPVQPATPEAAPQEEES